MKRLILAALVGVLVTAFAVQPVCIDYLGPDSPESGCGPLLFLVL